MRGLFIPEITAEMFRNGCLESIETLMAEGEIYDIDYQQPCEDCISRQAAIDEIEYELEMINSALDSIALDFNARERLRQRKGEVREILNSIQQLPSVTLLQKTGHWITWKEAGNEIPSETRFECSVCHDATQTLCNGLDLLSSYCPNCGARMEG